MSGCGNSLFGKGSQYIKINSGDFIAVEGSNVVEKLMASDIRMPYKQLLKGRIILKPGQVNYLMNHLGIGDNATFLSIKAIYDSKSVIEIDNYITYSYYDYPVQSLSFAQLLVLTGNSANRIPQLYLNNPNSKYPVVLDVMVGIIDDSYSFFNDDINQSGTSFTGLEYTDIKSFVVGESIVVYDKNSPKRALIYLGLSYINSITLNGNFLVIDDESYGTVFLHFLTEYDAVQAHSLINYVLENPNVNIEDVIPGDDVSPIIYFKSTAGAGGSYIVFDDGVAVGATSSAPYDTLSNGLTFSTSISLTTYGSSGVINKQALRGLLIDRVEDGRDGIVEIQDSNLSLSGPTGQVSSILSTGLYSLNIDVSDLANNNIGAVVKISIID